MVYHFLASVLPLFLVLAPLVFFHELGHFLMARYFGVHVEAFSIGFGPEIFGWSDRLGTRWRFALFPLGGYVRLEKEETDQKSSRGWNHRNSRLETARSAEFAAKHPFQKILIAFSGPFANYLLAAVLFAFLFFSQGAPRPTWWVEQVQTSSLAEEAGFKTGDEILALDGQPLTSLEGFQEALIQQSGCDVRKITWRRGEEEKTSSVVQSDLMRFGRLGLEVKMVTKKQALGLFSSVCEGARATYSLTTMILKNLFQPGALKKVGGVLMIGKAAKDAVSHNWSSLVYLAALLSVNLGLINLFPLPVLDGGMILFYGAEWCLGRALPTRFREWFLYFGFFVVVLLFVLTTWNDLMRLNIFGLFRG